MRSIALVPAPRAPCLRRWLLVASAWMSQPCLARAVFCDRDPEQPRSGGHQPLPEARLDRFDALEPWFPDRASERALLCAEVDPTFHSSLPRLAPEALQQLQQRCSAQHCSSFLIDYVLDLVEVSRQRHPGLSPRASQGLWQLHALVAAHGRDHVVIDDVQAVLPAVVNIAWMRLSRSHGAPHSEALLQPSRPCAGEAGASQPLHHSQSLRCALDCSSGPVAAGCHSDRKQQHPAVAFLILELMAGHVPHPRHLQGLTLRCDQPHRHLAVSLHYLAGWRVHSSAQVQLACSGASGVVCDRIAAGHDPRFSWVAEHRGWQLPPPCRSRLLRRLGCSSVGGAGNQAAVDLAAASPGLLRSSLHAPWMVWRNGRTSARFARANDRLWWTGQCRPRSALAGQAVQRPRRPGDPRPAGLALEVAGASGGSHLALAPQRRLLWPQIQASAWRHRRVCAIAMPVWKRWHGVSHQCHSSSLAWWALPPLLLQCIALNWSVPLTWPTWALVLCALFKLREAGGP